MEFFAQRNHVWVDLDHLDTSLRQVTKAELGERADGKLTRELFAFAMGPVGLRMKLTERATS